MKTRPFFLGLTGSIGMGKSTTAKMFEQEGAKIWDADAAVHRLYAVNGGAVEGIRALCPDAIVEGTVDRSVLKAWIAQSRDAFQKIEKLVHPLVAQDRATFISENMAAEVLVFDIPLLFETGSVNDMDGVVVVSAPADIQRQRVLARPDMTAQQFEVILAKQLPDAEKRARADYLVETISLEVAQDAVQNIMKDIKESRLNA